MRKPVYVSLASALFFMLLLFLFPSAALWAGNVSGRIQYTDKLYDFSSDEAGYVGTLPKPARYIEVELRRSDNSALLGSGSTDGEGNYSFAISDAGTIEVDLYLIAHSSASPWGDVFVLDNKWDSFLQSLVVGPFERNTNGTFSLDYTVPTDSGGKRLGGMFNIVDSILHGAELVSARLGAPVGPITIYWEDGSTNGTYYSSNRIYLYGGDRGSPTTGDDDSYDDAVILHEYGHYLADRYSWDRSPGGSHHLDGYYSPVLTWSEGWASAFQCIARNSALYWDATDGDTGGFNLDYETGSENGVILSDLKGMNNEVMVTCVLYDLFDDASSHDNSPAGDDDSCEGGAEEIWTVFDQDFVPSVLATMDDFYQGWKIRYPALPVDEVFAAFGMEMVPLRQGEKVYSALDLDLSIPDNDPGGVAGTIQLPAGVIQADGVRVWVAALHSYRGDLSIRLRHPDGDSIPLKLASDSDWENDVTEWYGFQNYEKPTGNLSSFEGRSSAGLWTLEISDEGALDTGTLVDWRLKVLTQTGSEGFLQVY